MHNKEGSQQGFLLKKMPCLENLILIVGALLCMQRNHTHTHTHILEQNGQFLGRNVMISHAASVSVSVLCTLTHIVFVCVNLYAIDVAGSLTLLA